MADDDRSAKTEALRQRLLLVLKDLYAGNQSRMAGELGVSQTLLSKIALGQRSPGKRVTEALAAHPRVSPRWLRTGVGVPFVAERPSSRERGTPIPVATSLLPGPPRQYRALLSDQVELVPGAIGKPTLYALAVKANDPLVTSQSDAVLAGDSLLIDADPDRWHGNRLSLDNRLCVVHRKVGGVQLLELCRVRCSQSSDGMIAHRSTTSFGSPQSHRESEPSRNIDLNEYSSKAEQAGLPVGGQPDLPSVTEAPGNIRIEDIRGVVLQLIRRF